MAAKSYRGFGKARTPKYASGGKVEAPPAPPPEPTLGQRLRRLVGMETKSEAGADNTLRRRKLDQAETNSLK